MRQSEILVLSRNNAGELDTLEKIVDYIAAEEAGINESNNLNNQNTVGGLRRSYHKNPNHILLAARRVETVERNTSLTGKFLKNLNHKNVNFFFKTFLSQFKEDNPQKN